MTDAPTKRVLDGNVSLEMKKTDSTTAQPASPRKNRRGSADEMNVDTGDLDSKPLSETGGIERLNTTRSQPALIRRDSILDKRSALQFMMNPTEVLESDSDFSDPLASLEETTSLGDTSSIGTGDIKRSEYEEMDDVDIDLDLTDLGKDLSKAENQQSRFVKTSKKISRRVKKVEQAMETAPFWRTADKLAYVIGTFMIVFYSYFMGRYPNTHFYTFCVVVLILLIASRYAHYYLRGWHYYCTDFCYFANFALIATLVYCPQNEAMVRMCYLFSQGALSAAVVAFRNSLVYHKIDMLTSLAIHVVPMTLCWNLRWNTIPDQQALPKEERYFADLTPLAELTWTQYFNFNLFYPMAFYIVWVVWYGIVNFYFAADVIKQRNYDSTYVHFGKKPFVRKILDKSRGFAPVVFCFGHFLFWLATHCLAMIHYHFYWINSLAVVTWVTISVWNGACFYMEWFAKRYEKQLEKLKTEQERIKTE